MNVLKIHTHMITLTVLLLAGCTQTPQQVWLAPTVHVQASFEGNGTTIAVNVVDGRPSKSLGYFGKTRDASSEITTAQDITAVVAQEILTGMRNKGFVVVDGKSKGDAKLTVEVRLLDYSTAPDTLTGSVNIKSALRVVAAKNGKYLEKTYRADNEKRVVVVPSAATNEQWINEAFSDVLRQLFADSQLSLFLTQ